METLAFIALALVVVVGLLVICAGVAMLAFTIGMTVQHHINFGNGQGAQK